MTKSRRKGNPKQDKIRAQKYYQMHKESLKVRSNDNYHRRKKAEGKTSVRKKYPE